MRPAKVSATTGPADIRSTTGCSPVGSAGKPPRFLPIPHDNNDLRNRRIPRTQGFRIILAIEPLAKLSGVGDIVRGERNSACLILVVAAIFREFGLTLRCFSRPRPPRL